MVTSGYEEVDHIADLALHVWGSDFEALLREAACGMYALMNIEPNLKVQISAAFYVPQGSAEMMLVDFLSELLYLTEENRELFTQFNISIEEENLLIRASGHPISSIKRVIKAVTYHNLNLIHTDNGVEATITFDV